MNRSTTSSITRSTDFLSVPSTKRQRTSKDGRWRSRSPSESSNGDMSRSTTPMFDQSPSPSAGSSTSMEFEWSQSIGQQAQIAQGEDCHTADEVADDEECFGTICCHCSSTRDVLETLQARCSSSSVFHVSLTIVAPASKSVELSLQTGDGTILGHIEQNIRTTLHSLLVRDLVRIQGVALLPFGYNQVRSKSNQKVTTEVYLNVFGPPEVAAPVGRFLSDNSVFLQHPIFPEPGFAYKNPHLISKCYSGIITECTATGGVPVIPNKPVLNNCTAVLEATELLDFFNNIGKAAIMDEVHGDHNLKTPLMSHQKQALYFLLRRERGLSVFDTSSAAIGKITCDIKGGILADHMGLGKTLSILSLITGTLEEARRVRAQEPIGRICASGTTLIVTPVSTLGNWEQQISTHVLPGRLSVLVYHGKNRAGNSNAATLSRYDIILTTPSVVSHEWSSAHHPLHELEFYRLVIDEAHDIRTEKTQRSRAICALNAGRRWAVTGTPIQNNLMDIATLFKFLRYKPLHTAVGFKKYVLTSQPGTKTGIDNLRSALKAVCLRRAKSIIDLPERKEQIRFLSFNTEEKALYEFHKRLLSREYNAMSSSGPAEALKCLLKLRMICDHGHDLISTGSSTASSALEPSITCCVCNQQITSHMQFEGLGCPHRSMCAGCIEIVPLTDSDMRDCDQCSVDEVTTPEATPSLLLSDYPVCPRPSTKVKALLQMILSENTDDGNVKSKHVVFSEWTRMLDLVGFALHNSGIKFCRLDGSMQRSRRDAALCEYRENPQCTVILISLMAGGVGIDLTCASRVHLMEPHWNPMVELQALERVHRFGQQRDVLITRYIMQDSFENDILRRQKLKLDMAKQSLDAGKAHIMKCDIRQEIIASLGSMLSTGSLSSDPGGNAHEQAF
ncbi:SNF2 family N-terminal domain-containing protein [Tricharina praecox]|uniref:SNF2 family N-terminal domain-containing protein n=1 Tax=Tricharina praecox TaxID=43433 RepID=UPI00221E3A45|nr:SNF2 family N-terminal domain-containing protein [Tricharina praecox]KAI5858908.1 SNF2 family N-terminal domain-containing protein [Tricharina praecox]